MVAERYPPWMTRDQVEREQAFLFGGEPSQTIAAGVVRIGFRCYFLCFAGHWQRDGLGQSWMWLGKRCCDQHYLEVARPW
jgi:hypothetical protein